MKGFDFKITLKDIKDAVNEIQQENEQLKQQLAEKEKEIESLRNKAFIDMTYKEILELKVSKHYQDKISFAVEQIMQIREKIENSEKICIGITLDGIYEFDNIFDNKIKQLKEGK